MPNPAKKRRLSGEEHFSQTSEPTISPLTNQDMPPEQAGIIAAHEGASSNQILLSPQTSLVGVQDSISHSLGEELANILFSNSTSVANGRINVPQEIIKYMGLGVDPNYIYPQYNQRKTFLHLAGCRDEWVRTLLQYPVNPDIPDEQGHTPFYYAAKNCYEKVFKLLLPVTSDKNPIINLENRTTLLHECLKQENIIKILNNWLLSGIDPNIQDNYGDTPLHYLVYYHCLDSNIFKEGLIALINAGVDINRKNSAGFTPLHAVAIALNPDIRGQYNQYSCKFAVGRFNEYESGIITSYNLLLDHGADPSIADRNGRTPTDLLPDWLSVSSSLRLASGRLKRSALSLLGASPASRNILAIEGNKPLTITAGSGVEETSNTSTTLLLTSSETKTVPSETTFNSAVNQVAKQPEAGATDISGNLTQQKPRAFRIHIKKHWKLYALSSFLALGVAAVLTVPGIGFAFGFSAALGYALISTPTALYLGLFATGAGLITFGLVTAIGLIISDILALRKRYKRIEGAVTPVVPNSSYSQVPTGEAATTAPVQADIHTTTPVTPSPIGAGATGQQASASAQDKANLAEARQNQL
jgi:ankyrin repeat protein